MLEMTTTAHAHEQTLGRSRVCSPPRGADDVCRRPGGALSAGDAPGHVALGHNQLVDCLAAIPDEIDYAMVLITRDGVVQYRNRAAHRELQEQRALSVVCGRLRVLDPRDAQAVEEAIHAAADRGLRRMLTLVGGPAPQSVAFVPIGPAAAAAAAAAAATAAAASPGAMRRDALVLVLLGKRGLCAPLSADVFARYHGLTNSETHVLGALLQGYLPSGIARLHGVALSTVRTHMQSIRNKTGARRIQEIITRMASLPPLVTTLRG